MLKHTCDSRNVSRSIRLLFTILILVGFVGSVDGSVYVTYYVHDCNILNGAYLAGSVPASVQTVDSDCFTVRSLPSGISISTYNPSAYNLLENTTHVSGTIADLVSNSSAYLTFGSYAQTLYSHQEMTTIGGTSYYSLKLGGSDIAGTTLSADAGTLGRKLMGKFAYQLTGVSNITASTWTVYYRTYRDAGSAEAHGDIDILIRMSNGTVRTTLATNAANSGGLITSWSTLSGTFSWTPYTVVDQTDYLEIDYYLEVTANQSGKYVFLRIDDNTLDGAYQTRATNICLLNENAKAQAPPPTFDWVRALLYFLPVVFGLFVLVLGFKRKNKPKSRRTPENKTEASSLIKTGAFSKQFGMTYQQMKGQRMLLEIDPTSDYHLALSNFVNETKNHGESLFILTNKNSRLHSAFLGASNVKFLVLTSETSSPRQINESERLLPSNDLSVMLNACVTIQKTTKEENLNMLFDDLSGIMLRCGFEKTYKFLGFLLEAMPSSKTTALFVLNPTAHDQTTLSAIRGFFHNHLTYAKNGQRTATL